MAGLPCALGCLIYTRLQCLCILACLRSLEAAAALASLASTAATGFKRAAFGVAILTSLPALLIYLGVCNVLVAFNTLFQRHVGFHNDVSPHSTTANALLE